MNGIVFLDRDGTLIEDSGYLSDPDRLVEIPGASEALRALAAGGLALAVVSNQAGLARGKFTEADLSAVHAAFVRHFKDRGVSFDAVEYCPHHPEGVVERYRIDCDCRKPGTGMPERILARLQAPRSCSRWVVGDKLVDIEMGRRIGAGTVLVATGHGTGERGKGEREGVVPDAFLADIGEAARWILAGGNH
jgi:D-glycero-D-manno-heptose 1,7-bisphosphate phosphatase